MCSRPSPIGLRRRRLPEGEDALALEKELALLGKEHAESAEVYLLLVGLDLGEVGIYGEIRGHAIGDTVLGVEADIRVEVVVDLR